MTQRNVVSALSLLIIAWLTLAGCGEKTVVVPATSKLAESEVCIGCHDGNNFASSKRVSKITGKLISEEWKLSGHNTGNGASCADCHEPEPGHPNSCNRCHAGTPSGNVAVHDVTVNADAAGKCAKCHTQNGGFKRALTAHFNNITSANYPASYVSFQYEKNCRKCHNPHDTASASEHLKDWATSGHGTVAEGIFHDFRTASRTGTDFKTAGSFDLKASQALSDSTNGNNQVCIRCHTTTGFINYVKSGFSDLSPFGPNDPATGKPYRLDDYKSLSRSDKSKLSPDKSKELTNCDACHDNGSGVAYGYNLRTVGQVTSYYNYSSASGVSLKGGGGSTPIGGAIRGFGLKYPDVGASNICVTCHSGRLTGQTIYMVDARGIEFDKTSRITNHFRGAAELIFRPTDKNGKVVGAGFEFYSSGSAKLQNYNNFNFTHNIIGTTLQNSNRLPDGTLGMTAEPRGYGPCIGCHMNARGNDGTSHTFLPVNRTASSTFKPGELADGSNPITIVTSKACATCHHDEFDLDSVDPASGLTYNRLQLEKVQFRAAFNAFARLLAFAVDSRLPTATDIANPLTPTNTNTSGPNRVWIDAEGRPGTPRNWYGSNTTDAATRPRLQPWLRTSTKADNSNKPAGGLDYYVLGAQFDDPLTGASYPVRNAAYTMGAAYNFYLLYYDPGAFVHNRRYVKRLVFDSMDWLDDGKLNKSVCDPAKTFVRVNDSRNRQYPQLNTYGTGLVGQNDTFLYSTYLTPDELKQASYYICGSTVTANNTDGTIKSFTADHRPAP